MRIVPLKRIFYIIITNWLSNEYINYSELDNKELVNRTNNFIENFHRNLKTCVEIYHPKLSYFMHKVSIYLKNLNERLKDSLINPIVRKKEKFSFINGMLKYLRDYRKN